jgi:chromate reductase, NAD(P)H dehydrogenase (quinone)
MATSSSPFRILAIPGSLRRESFNRVMLNAAIEHAPEGVEIEMFDGLGSIPHFNEDHEGDRTPQAVLEFRRRIDQADALLFSTPEYNHSVPGAIKNAVDWASRPTGRSEIVAKPSAVMSSSTSAFGGVWAQAELRKSLGASGARVLEDGVGVSKAAERVDAEGRLADPEVIARIVALLGDLKALAETPLDEW